MGKPEKTGQKMKKSGKKLHQNEALTNKIMKSQLTWFGRIKRILYVSRLIALLHRR